MLEGAQSQYPRISKHVHDMDIKAGSFHVRNDCTELFSSRFIRKTVSSKPKQGPEIPADLATTAAGVY